MSIDNSGVQFVTKPAFSLVGVLARSQPGDQKIMQTWEDLMAQMERIPNPIESNICYGAMHNFDMQTNQFDYVAGVQTPSQSSAPDGMVRWEIPEQLYAVFPTTLPAISQTFGDIYGSWMATSGYTRTDGPEFELYGDDFDPNNPDSTVYIYIPVKEK